MLQRKLNFCLIEELADDIFGIVPLEKTQELVLIRTAMIWRIKRFLLRNHEPPESDLRFSALIESFEQNASKPLHSFE